MSIFLDVAGADPGGCQGCQSTPQKFPSFALKILVNSDFRYIYNMICFIYSEFCKDFSGIDGKLELSLLAYIEELYPLSSAMNASS